MAASLSPLTSLAVRSGASATASTETVNVSLTVLSLMPSVEVALTEKFISSEKSFGAVMVAPVSGLVSPASPEKSGRVKLVLPALAMKLVPSCGADGDVF
ncbi:MAG: hypothetical protein ACPGQV_17710 [Alphaproteobacteria bacterium]